MTPIGLAMIVLLLAASILAAALAAFAWRRRGEPGTRPFAALMVALVVWATMYAAGLLTADPTLRTLWAQLEWLGKASVPVCALAFALEYTGHDDVLTRRTLVAVSVIPALTVFVVWTNPWHGLMWPTVSLVHAEGVVLFVTDYGSWFWLSFAYLYALIAIGAVLILRLIFLSDRLYLDQSLLLLVGIVAPVAGNFASTIGAAPLPGLDMTPYLFALSGVTFGYALFRGRLFAIVPATRSLGRDAAIKQLDAGVVIVNRDQQVVFANAAAASILNTDSATLLDAPIDDHLTTDALPAPGDDEPGTLERGNRLYAVRASPITNRSDRKIGRTFIIADVTARERRKRRLAAQRDELKQLDDLNAVIRGVNQALVSASTRAEIERAVCDHLATSAVAEAAIVGDVPSWTGQADRWTAVGISFDDIDGPPTLEKDAVLATDGGEATHGGVVVDDGPTACSWLVIPLAYGHTVYGALGLRIERDAFDDRQREVLAELGQTVGNAINAVESRNVFDADGVVELSVSVDATDDPIAATSRIAGTSVDIIGLVPRNGKGHLAFADVANDAAVDVEAALVDAGISVSVVGDNADDALLEITADENTPLGPITERGAHLLGATAVDGRADYRILVSSTSEARTLLDRLESAFPSVDLRAKRERDHPLEDGDTIPADRVAKLTDRQREALESAYHAGYFEWPREANAEEVAESMDISSPTLHNHLRKAQRALFEDLFERDTD